MSDYKSCCDGCDEIRKRLHVNEEVLSSEKRKIETQTVFMQYAGCVRGWGKLKDTNVHILCQESLSCIL